MGAKLIRLALLLPFVGGLCGCAPSALFSSIDRHCFLADWTNHHSCVSCCGGKKNGSCRRPAPADYPMLVLGNSSAADHAIK